MKKLIASFFVVAGLGMLSSFAFYETETDMDCYVVADIDNAEIIYIPDSSEFDGRIFEEPE